MAESTIAVARTPALSASGQPHYLSRDRRIQLAGLAFGVLVFALEWFRHASYRSAAFDLGYFESVWLMAHGHTPFVTLIGRNIFGDHFSPALRLFVPLYAIASTPFWLLAAQAVALGFGLIALAALLDQFDLPNGWRLAFFVAYAASPALWNAALFDFHMSTLAVPFLIVGLTAALRDDPRVLGLMGAALLLIRDDLGLAVIAILLIGATGSGHRRFRLSLGLVALAWVVVAGRYGQSVASPQLWQAHYGYLGSNSASAARHPFRSLARIAQVIWSGHNLSTVTYWLSPFGFLPLLSPAWTLLGFLWVLPVLASARFSGGELAALDHGVIVLPFLVLAAARTADRLRHRLVAFAGPWVLATFALSSLAVANPFATWIFDSRAPPPAIAGEALSLVRPTDRVTATQTLGSHLSHRVVLLPFPYPFMRGDDTAPLDANVTRTGKAVEAQIDVVAIYLGQDGNSLRVRRAFCSCPICITFA